MALTLAQCISLYLLKDVTSIWVLFILAYCIGGVANHALMLAIHEISHNMAFGIARPMANRIMGIFANLPIGIPMSISFRKYHLEHHRYQGDEKLDTDIPTDFEGKLFTSTGRKIVWCILQPFFYTMRPLFVNPKPFTQLEMANLLIQLIFDLLVIKYLGWHVLAYMIGGSVLAMGLHPVAGHFISEHFLINDNKDKPRQDKLTNGNGIASALGSGIANRNGNGIAKPNGDVKNSPVNNLVDKSPTNVTLSDDGTFLIPETSSYYGPLNWVTFNVGYHVEHHDFPSIPGSNLHKLQKIAPEFYLSLPYHTSWTNVLWQYITNPNVGPTARVRRPANAEHFAKASQSS